MTLQIASLNSGSNGNCYYVGNNEEAVLIDVGISCREIEKRMNNLQLPMQRIKSIFITHEHIDHIRGVSVLTEKYKIPVYITNSTLRNTQLFLNKQLLFSFEANKNIRVGNLTITPFNKLHDAADPYSFMVECHGTHVGVITDIGVACDQVIHHFKQCNACFLESNYDEQMLHESNYPLHLKRRISSGKGHLSNKQALELFLNHKPDFMSHLILSHLSKNNNRPDLAKSLFDPHA